MRFALQIPCRLILAFFLLFSSIPVLADEHPGSWIRINLMGYAPDGVKVAVLGSKDSKARLRKFQLVNASTGRVVLSGSTGKNFGAYGPFGQSYRLDFSRNRQCDLL